MKVQSSLHFFWLLLALPLLGTQCHMDNTVVVPAATSKTNSIWRNTTLFLHLNYLSRPV